jgi:hypothetical protein
LELQPGCVEEAFELGMFYEKGFSKDEVDEAMRDVLKGGGEGGETMMLEVCGRVEEEIGG